MVVELAGLGSGLPPGGPLALEGDHPRRVLGQQAARRQGWLETVFRRGASLIVPFHSLNQ